MKLCLGILLLLLLGAALASDVLDLTEENFESVVSAHPLIMVEFFAPWCGHCKNLAPKYEEAATQLKGIATLAKVDCTSQAEICESNDVRGYPTLKVFRDGHGAEYQGDVETESLVAYLKRQAEPAVSTLEDQAELIAFTNSHRVAVIGYFTSLEGPEASTFAEVAKRMRDQFSFGASASSEAAAAAGVTAPSVVLFKHFDEGKNVFGGELTAEALHDFVVENGLPIMDDLGPQNYAQFMDAGLPMAYLFVTPESRGQVGPQVEAVAKELRGKMSFIYIDALKYGGHAGNVGLTVGNWPAFTVHYPHENTKFPFTGPEITTEAIRAFTSEVLAGTAPAHVKSQPVPEAQGNVKVIVGHTYRDFIGAEGPTKVTLVKFYAPWCGHCKSMAKDYERLGDFFAGSSEVVIAEMDAVENDLPADAGFAIDGFPTLKLFKPSGEVMDYEGDRSFEDLKRFVTSELQASSGAASEHHHAEREEL